MKAITKDGRIVDVSLYQEEKWYNKDNSSEVFSPSELDFVDDNYSKVEKIGKDCEEKQAELPDTSVRSNLRLQVAMAAMQGILANDHLLRSVMDVHFRESGSRDMFAATAIAARMYADVLLAECGMCHKD